MNTQNAIKRYNSITYPEKLVKFKDYISDKNNILHKKLYESALQGYLKYKYVLTDYDDRYKTIKSFNKNFKVIELKNSEYWKPSSIVIMSRTFPFSKETINLSSWWNLYQNAGTKSYKDIKIKKDDLINNYEVIYLDYVNGIATLKSRYSGEILKVDFDMIPSDTPVSEEYSLKNSFMRMAQI